MTQWYCTRLEHDGNQGSPYINPSFNKGKNIENSRSSDIQVRFLVGAFQDIGQISLNEKGRLSERNRRCLRGLIPGGDVEKFFFTIKILKNHISNELGWQKREDLNLILREN